jgi:SAM-dependent methyltransferase
VRSKLVRGEYGRVRVGCPLCGAEEPLPVSEKDMYGLPHPVAVCRRCGFVYTWLRLDDSALGRFYDCEYRQLDRGVPLPEESFYALEYGKGTMIEGHLRAAGIELGESPVVLEVGCGAGGILGWFRERGYRVLGVDLGAEYVAFGREGHGLPLFEGDAETGIALLAADGTRPDLVIYEQVLEHVTDPLAELRRVRQCLPAHGHLFVGVPGLRNIARHYDSDVLRYLQLPHLSHFDLTSLQAVALEAGLALRSGTESVHAVFGPARAAAKARRPDPPNDTLRRLKHLERTRALRETRGRVLAAADRAAGRAGRAVRRALALGAGK